MKKIISHLELLSCSYCRFFKQQISSIDYFNHGQIRINTICDVCGMIGFFDLLDENLLPQIENKIKPLEDVREIALTKIQKQRLKEIKKKEKKQIKIKQVIK